jgi:hypothetical protein
MKINSIIFIIAASAISRSDFAQADVPPISVPSDVSVTLTATPSTNLHPGETIQLSLSVKNNGPQPLSNIPILSSHFYDEFNSGDWWTDCQLFTVVVDDGTPFSYYRAWYPTDGSPMAVGETRTCHIRLSLSTDAPPVTTFSFRLPDFYSDPDVSNDRGTVYLVRAVDATPIPTIGPIGAAILMLLLVAACRQPLRRSKGGRR